MIPKVTVSLPLFEGPLDLLLYLIQHEEIDVSDVSVQKVTSQFLTQERELDTGAEFVGNASLLLLLKSQSLLPQAEERKKTAPYATLLHNLIEYCSLKEAAGQLAKVDGLDIQHSFPRAPAPPPIPPLAPSDFDLGQLGEIFTHLIKEVKESKTIKEEGFIVSERMEFLRRLLPSSIEELFSFEKTREEMIATFLALLQLIKQQEVMLNLPYVNLRTN